MLISTLYIVLFLLSVLAVYLLLKNISNRRAGYYIVLFTLISVVCLAYFSYSVANDAGMALVSNQFTYFDGTFILLFFLLCIMDICGLRMPKFLGFVLSVLCLVFLFLAFSAGHYQIFYKSVTFARYKGASHLIMEFGPLRIWFMIFVVLNTLAPMCIVVYSFFQKNKISYKYVLALGLIEIAIVMIYFIEYSVGFGFDLLPCGYVFMEYVILGITQRIGLYDVSQVAFSTSNDRKEIGYIIFDRRKCFVGADETAKYYFPELKELDIDRVVIDTFVRDEFVVWIDEALEKNSTKLFSRQGRKIICAVKPYIRGKKNHIYGYIIELRDDTKQQRFIDELNKINKELENAVEMSNEANKAKSQFLANMSHEIRTPINAILGINEIALRECNDDNLISYMEDIRNAGHNLLFIINDILDFSKIEAGKMDIIDEEYEVKKLIKDVIDMVEIKTKEKGLEFILDISSKLPSKLHGDVNRIRQVMVNVLNNAVKYTEKGSVKLSLYCNSEINGFCDFVIQVTDTGIGIKDEDKVTLFESFARLEEKRNSNVEGTGLGLAITSRLIERMAGSIKVDSVYGEGSTFTLTIPQKIIDAMPIGVYENVRPKGVHKGRYVSSLDAEGVKILVVDDNRVNLAVAQGLLKPTKAIVTTCMSGRACLDELVKNKYDIVLLDHMMPEMDGIETLHKAMEMENNISKEAAYIALTANAISGMRDMYLSEGFADYISKPIDVETLEKTLAKYINK